MNIFKKLFFLIFFLNFGTSFLFSEEGTIKFATLAPEGSTWLKVLRAWNKEIMEKSNGQLKFKIYSGGVSGDEKDVVRKIRLGQLQAGGFTGVGLGEIAPEVRILDTPFLFRDSNEIDYIYGKFEKEWVNAFEKKGYIFLGWAEVGFVHFFVSKPIQGLNDLKKLKIWMWEGDPIAEITFKTMGISPIPLSIADVMTSLQTGLIEGVYCSPMAAIALQWFTRTKYMVETPLANASGAVLISKSSFDRLKPELKQLLLESGKKHLKQLTNLSRLENRDSIATLKKNGIQLILSSSEKEIESNQKMGEDARKKLAGKLYEVSLLGKIEKALEEYRLSLH